MNGIFTQIYSGPTAAPARPRAAALRGHHQRRPRDTPVACARQKKRLHPPPNLLGLGQNWKWLRNISESPNCLEYIHKIRASNISTIAWVTANVWFGNVGKCTCPGAFFAFLITEWSRGLKATTSSGSITGGLTTIVLPSKWSKDVKSTHEAFELANTILLSRNKLTRANTFQLKLSQSKSIKLIFADICTA